MNKKNNIIGELCKYTTKRIMKDIISSGVKLSKEMIATKAPHIQIDSDMDGLSKYRDIVDWFHNIEDFRNKYMVKSMDYDCGYALQTGVYVYKYNNTILYIRSVRRMVTTEKDQFSNKKIDIYAFGRDSQKILDEIMEHSMPSDNNTIRVIKGDRRARFVNKKYINSIYTDSKNEILNFINNFMSLKEYHERVGLLYKTGLLLYGPSGTGKTTVVKIIASITNFGVRSINLLDINNTTYIPDNTIILFEDIDRDVDRLDEQNKENVSMSTLLNFIDGIDSPNNVIFIATTNHIEKLDEALIRHGRFDKHIKMDNICEKTARDMCVHLECNPDVILSGEKFPINPAYLQAKCIASK